MTTKPTHEQISKLRWLAIVALVALFLSENLALSFEVWRNPVPKHVYWGVLAIAVGIDFPTIRGLVLHFLEGFAGDKKK